MNIANSLDRSASFVLRVGVGAAILWFGINELLDPASWTVWVPTWALGFGLSKLQILYLNGAFESIASIFVIFGIWTRSIAFLMFLHMGLIVYDIGVSPVGVRDFAIAIALLAMSLKNPDEFSLKQ